MHIKTNLHHTDITRTASDNDVERNKYRLLREAQETDKCTV